MCKCVREWSVHIENALRARASELYKRLVFFFALDDGIDSEFLFSPQSFSIRARGKVMAACVSLHR